MSDDSEFVVAYQQRVEKYLKFLEMETHGSVTEEFCKKYNDLVDGKFSPDSDKQNVLKFCKDEGKVLPRAEFLKLVGTEFEECKKRLGYKHKGFPSTYKHNEVIFAPPTDSHLGFFVHHDEYHFENELKKQVYNEECKQKVRSVVSMKNLFNQRTGRDVNALMCSDSSCLKFMKATEKNCDSIFKHKVEILSPPKKNFGNKAKIDTKIPNSNASDAVNAKIGTKIPNSIASHPVILPGLSVLLYPLNMLYFQQIDF
jgi:hypothetical protein